MNRIPFIDGRGRFSTTGEVFVSIGMVSCQGRQSRTSRQTLQQRRVNANPQVALSPMTESFVGSRPYSILFWKVTPWGTGCQDPIDHLSLRYAKPPRLPGTLLRRVSSYDIRFPIRRMMPIYGYFRQNLVVRKHISRSSHLFVVRTCEQIDRAESAFRLSAVVSALSEPQRHGAGDATVKPDTDYDPTDRLSLASRRLSR